MDRDIDSWLQLARDDYAGLRGNYLQIHDKESGEAGRARQRLGFDESAEWAGQRLNSLQKKRKDERKRKVRATGAEQAAEK